MPVEEGAEANSDERLGRKTKKRPDGRSGEIPYFYPKEIIAHITKMLRRKLRVARITRQCAGGSDFGGGSGRLGSVQKIMMPHTRRT
jgi:hypothetical protein